MVQSPLLGTGSEPTCSWPLTPSGNDPLTANGLPGAWSRVSVTSMLGNTAFTCRSAKRVEKEAGREKEGERKKQGERRAGRERGERKKGEKRGEKDGREKSRERKRGEKEAGREEKEGRERGERKKQDRSKSRELSLR